MIQEFRSSGVQEFRSSGVQEFRSSGVQEFRSSGVQEFRSSGVQESWYEIFLQFKRRILKFFLRPPHSELLSQPPPTMRTISIWSLSASLRLGKLAR
jgi:hypothetical protein